MARAVWLNHAPHTCQRCPESAGRAHPGDTRDRPDQVVPTGIVPRHPVSIPQHVAPTSPFRIIPASARASTVVPDGAAPDLPLRARTTTALRCARPRGEGCPRLGRTPARRAPAQRSLSDPVAFGDDVVDRDAEPGHLPANGGDEDLLAVRAGRRLLRRHVVVESRGEKFVGDSLVLTAPELLEQASGDLPVLFQRCVHCRLPFDRMKLSPDPTPPRPVSRRTVTRPPRRTGRRRRGGLTCFGRRS
jgi:hypothetical protein